MSSGIILFLGLAVLGVIVISVEIAVAIKGGYTKTDLDD